MCPQTELPLELQARSSVEQELVGNETVPSFLRQSSNSRRMPEKLLKKEPQAPELIRET